MRKRILDPVHKQVASDDPNWLDLDSLAEVEVTSEDPAHPIEAALLPNRTSGWRAGGLGEQTIRLLFSSPQRVRHIRLNFVESETDRTQEYVLRCSQDGGKTFRDLARQQWNFSPQGSTTETEDHRVDLPNVTVLELCIIPDIGGNSVPASLDQMRVA
ncbi:MAG: discoidin domain-containing protein [Nitrospira sp.]|nr:discoidin domain-containing protein [Nitrospira sp.]MDH4370229.1 discoidin domain-containing protein [Nitrospira sp.]MDH5346510.1 discoidin domain-containing protein [Nitrospira sp.]MDH5496312.1 discoidin domain-containing protein [Nitrospira sp.]MDH5723841.1 discoidin domain-containing protein [Nitrospira sp.]